jgi:two-component system, OmpR family, sensor histidine kinase SenX3
VRIISRQKAIYFFLTLGVLLAAVAFAVGSGWIILNWRAGIKVFLGIIFFGAIVAGLVLNTIFLVREIRRNEQHDSFINAVTHELKTPIASIRLYLQTLQRREVDEAQRRQFYDLMLLDTERLMGTVEQVLRAGEAAQKKSPSQRLPVDFNALVQECMELARTRHHLQPAALDYHEFFPVRQGDGAQVLGDPEELRTAVSNLLDNAVKYSPDGVHISVELEAPDERAGRAPRARSRRRHSAAGVETDLQALLSRNAALALASERHRPGIVHRAFDRAQARRPRVLPRARAPAKERP